MPNAEVSIQVVTKEPDLGIVCLINIHSTAYTHARKANMAHRKENKTKEAICAAIPARKMLPPACAVLTCFEMDNPPPAAWIKKVKTLYQLESSKTSLGRLTV